MLSSPLHSRRPGRLGRGIRTHFEKRPAVERRPRNLPLGREPREIQSHSALRSRLRLGQPLELRALHVPHELVREEELHTCRNGRVDDERRRLVLRRPARDAVHDGVLASEGILQGLEGGVVDGLDGDVGARWWGIARGGARDRGYRVFVVRGLQ
jgi:hypothetical protein